MGEKVSARQAGIQVCPEIRCPAHELRHGLRTRIERVHLASQRFELGQRDLARPALGSRRGDQLAVWAEDRRGERLDACRRQRRRQNVRRGVQVVLCVPADELEVFGKGHVALENPRAHAGARLVRFLRVLGKLQRGAAMADRERARPHRHARTAQQPLLQRAVGHFVDQEERPRAELNRGGSAKGVRARDRLGSHERGRCGHPEDTGECERDNVLAHGSVPSVALMSDAGSIDDRSGRPKREVMRRMWRTCDGRVSGVETILDGRVTDGTDSRHRVIAFQGRIGITICAGSRGGTCQAASGRTMHF